MKYYSLNKKAPRASFEEAVVRGLASDRGLYFPNSITPLSKEFIENLGDFSNEEIAYRAIKQFIGNEIPEKELKQIIKETISFDFPLVEISPKIFALELFHGPTMAFKDVGARFMARCLKYFNTNKNNHVTVLVATSGDTGGAVANGFLGVHGTDVVILYPSGKVSDIQEKQLTTLGENITALEVDGTFDDCQEMVKTAFLDQEISKKLTSANSINVARWLPQMFYYFFAYKQLKEEHKDVVFSVPSGNFGNICAGLMAQKLGLPIKHFIASTNINDTVPSYLKEGNYNPKPTKATISNAMDVSNPSNFIRIQELFNADLDELKRNFSSYSFSDEETRNAMKSIYNSSKYIADPHGAVGYLGLKKHNTSSDSCGVFLETAHPIKFLDIVEETLDIKVPIPPIIQSLITKEKQSQKITNYQDLKSFLLNN